MKLSLTATKAINILIQNGYKAYAVGGAVRDGYLMRDISDVDVTTSATPNEVIEVFNGYTVIPTGIKHGTVTLLIDNDAIEITTFRSESVYEDNRHPKSVEFVSNVESDLMRRDFTINAMAYNDMEGLIDPYGGRSDCDSKIIRAVGNAEERFQEDALRILRALRFASKLGFTIEKETSKAIFKYSYLLKNISAERIYAELIKIIMGDHAEEVLLKFRKIIFVIIPELEKCDGFDQKSKYHAYDVYTHIVKSVSIAIKDKTVRLACLLHDIAKPQAFSVDDFGRGHFYGHQELGAETAVNILKRLKVDNKTISTVEAVIRLHDTYLIPNRKNVKKFLSAYGIDLLKVLTEVRIGDALAHAYIYGQERAKICRQVMAIAQSIIDSGECYNLKMLAVNGNDLKKLGYSGEDIKRKLNILLNGVIDGKYNNDKESLLKAVK